MASEVPTLNIYARFDFTAMEQPVWLIDYPKSSMFVMH